MGDTIITRKEINRALVTLLVSLLTFGNMTFMPHLYSFAAETDVRIQITSFEPEKEIYKPGDVIGGTATPTNTSNLDKTEFFPGESVDVTMTVTNNSKAALDEWNIVPTISSDSDIGTITGYDADAPLEKLNKGESTSVTYTITFKEDIAASRSGTFTAIVAKGKKTGNTYSWDYPIASTTSGVFTVVNVEDKTEETEKESEEDKNTKASETAAPAKQMLQAGPLKATGEDSSSVDLAKRVAKGETYYVTAYISTNKSSYKPGDTVTVTMILANTAPDKAVSGNTMKSLEFSFYKGDTQLTDNTFSFGNVNLAKDSELSRTFTYTIPQNAADEETELKMTVRSTVSNLNWGDFTSLMTSNTAQCSTPLIIKAPESVYVESASNNDSNLPQNADGTLNVAFDLKNYQATDRDFTYSLKVEAAENMGEAKTDITSGLESFAWTGMPGIASETEMAANGSGTMPAANNGPAEAQAAVQTTLSDSLYGSYNAFYVTLTLTDTETGETSSQTAVVPRFKIDLSNYTFRFRDDTAGNSPNYVSKTGLNWLDTLYYGLVAADDDVPFNNAEEFKTFLESQPDEDTANSVLQKYIYDLYEPHVGVSGNYGDTNLYWPKDGKSPFHVQPVSKIDPMGTYTLADAGIDYGDEYFKNLNKTVAVSEEAGEGDRAYQLDLSTETDPRPINPSVYVIMVPTMWQMFDEAHATAQVGSGKTEKGSILTSVDEMAYLYDIKHALIRFAEYLKAQGSNAGIAIVNTQHGGDFSMIQGNSKTQTGYFTTDMDQLIQAIEGWDAYGDCEHVHWSQNQLNNAMASIPNTFAGWTDADGKPVSIDNVVKNMVVIAGPTENTNGTNGYGSKLTEGKYGNVDYVWGIRTDTGTTQVNIEGRSIYSWLDTKANQNTIKANNPYYTEMDDPNNPAYQICTSEDAVFNQLVNIFSYDKSATTTVKGTVENVTLEDIVTKEFSVESAVVTVTYLDDEGKPTGVVDTITMTDQSKGRIILEENQDGTTTVKGVVNKIEGRAVVDMKINIEAQEDFVGSNNVKTNSGTPEVSYEHGEEEYSEDFDDEPKVNVPIRFKVPDGLTVTVNAGETVDVDGDLPYTAEDKSETIVQEVQDLFDKGYQVNGTLIFQWYDENGQPVPGTTSSSCRVDNGKLEKDGNGNYIITIPDFDCPTDASDIGAMKTYKLRVTFEPDPAVEGSVGTEVLTHHDDGSVRINVVDKPEEPFDPGDPPEQYVPKLDPTISKQIDYLGDNTADKNNPDTVLDDEGPDGLDYLYRLYLNLQGDSEAYDLVLVVDNSNSMYKNYDMEGGKNRAEAVAEYLNGTENEDGFIRRFLEANPNNHLSIARFGTYSDELLPWIGQEDIQGTNNEVSLTAYEENEAGSTNYVAGLYSAKELLNDPEIQSSPNKKMVIFLGDGAVQVSYEGGALRNDDELMMMNDDAQGEPLARAFDGYLNVIKNGGKYPNGKQAVPDDNDYYKKINPSSGRIYEIAYSSYNVERYSIYVKNAVEGQKGDEDVYSWKLRDLMLDIPGFTNYVGITDQEAFDAFYEQWQSVKRDPEEGLAFIRNCSAAELGAKPYDSYESTKRSFLTFRDEVDDVVVHSVAFSADSSGVFVDECGNRRNKSEVLDFFARYGSGQFIYAENAQTLADEINKLCFMTDVEITDTLTDYVKPAVDKEFNLVLKRSDWTGEPVDLVVDGVLTDAGREILDNATIDEDTGKITVKFKPEYPVTPDFIFTASFNVQVTEEALEEYKSNGYSNNGDMGTDYEGNHTSDGRPGLYSNEEAKVTWKTGDRENSVDYLKPVIQVPETWLYELPSSGGIGNFPFAFLGSTLGAYALIHSFRRRKRIA